jgi:hypothetical protein
MIGAVKCWLGTGGGIAESIAVLPVRWKFTIAYRAAMQKHMR